MRQVWPAVCSTARAVVVSASSMNNAHQSIVAGHGDLGGFTVFGQLDRYNNAAGWKVSVLLFLSGFLKDLAGGEFNGFQMREQLVKLLHSQPRQKLVFIGAGHLKTCHPCPWLVCPDILADLVPPRFRIFFAIGAESILIFVTRMSVTGRSRRCIIL